MAGEVGSDVLGCRDQIYQEVVDTREYGIMSVVVPPLLQCIWAGIEDVDQGLTLAVEIAGWGWQLLPHVQVGIVREGVGERVQGKLEDSLREGHNCARKTTSRELCWCCPSMAGSGQLGPCCGRDGPQCLLPPTAS